MGAPQNVPARAQEPVMAYRLSASDVAKELQTDWLDGLNDDPARLRLEEYGPNEINTSSAASPFQILLRQIVNAMSLILIIAMAVSFAIQSWIEGGVVALVILINIVVGFFQEFKAEKTMDTLRSLSSPTAMVVRGGVATTVPTKEVVPGDLVILKTGDTVPADIRLTETVNFETDEALLTGESLPVRKDADIVFDTDLGPGDRINLAYSSSTIVKGRASGIVYATGMATEIGAIAAALGQKASRRRPVKRQEDGSAKIRHHATSYLLTGTDAIGRFLGVNIGTPLQRKLSKLALYLLGIAIICAIIVMGANKFSNRREIIIYAVATGLSMLPASLVVILTITMAAGTRRMVSRHVIVRNLNSIESLGGVTDICSDKTGTLTQGRMLARKAWVPAKGTYSVALTTDPFDPTVGALSYDPIQPKDAAAQPLKIDTPSSTSPTDLLNDNACLDELISVASFANLSHVHQHEGKWTARGDPTEIALHVLASRFGRNRSTLVATNDEEKVAEGGPEWDMVAEYPFDSSVKKMSVLVKHRPTGRLRLFSKGAVERMLDACINCVWTDSDELVELTEAMKSDIYANVDTLSSMGLRVLALASREWTAETDNAADLDRQNTVEVGLTFRGLVGIYDPPRPESEISVKACQNAGITVHMLTGDHPGTAQSIAANVGIIPSKDGSPVIHDGAVMTASQFDKLSDDEIDKLHELPLVIARCTPTTKVRMIDALHRRKRYAAMTGDGVNDSPALKRADVGIAMGMNGSDVAKEASDLILTDDNFASIVNAVEEGRRMFDNIQRFILHLLGLNVAQATIMLIGLAFKDSNRVSVFPISPVEALWIIMITSGLPDMGLGFEKAVPEIMHRPPHDIKSGVFTLEVMIDIFVYGLIVGGLGLSTFILVLYGFGDGDLGYNCNNSYKDVDTGVVVCDSVFRARTTVYACLTINAFVLAWQMVDMRRSFFRSNPGSPHRWTQWCRDIWQNQFLFWSIVGGFIIMFPTIYIPVINTSVFKHAPISWEWSIVVIEFIVFMFLCEFYLFIKRAFIRRRAAKKGLPDPLASIFPDMQPPEQVSGVKTVSDSVLYSNRNGRSEPDLEADKKFYS